MITLHNDNVIKFDYNHSNIYTITDVIKIGADKNANNRISEELTNNNSIFVDSVNGNDNNSGTNENPVKTIKKAIQLCTSERFIVIKDSGIYKEQNLILGNNVKGIIALEGQAPVIQPLYNTEYQHIDDLNVVQNVQDTGINLDGYTVVKAEQMAGGDIIFLLYKNEYPWDFYFCIYDPINHVIVKDKTSLGGSYPSRPFSICALPDDGYALCRIKPDLSSLIINIFNGKTMNYTFKKGTSIIISNPQGTIIGFSFDMCLKANGNIGLIYAIWSRPETNRISLIIRKFNINPDTLTIVNDTDVTIFSGIFIAVSFNAFVCIRSFSNNFDLCVLDSRSPSYFPTTIYVYNGTTQVGKIELSYLYSYLEDCKPVGANCCLVYVVSSAKYYSVINTNAQTVATGVYTNKSLTGVSICPDSENAFNIIGCNDSVGTTSLVFNRFYSANGARMFDEVERPLYLVNKITGVRFLVNKNTTNGETYFIGRLNNSMYMAEFTGYLWDAIIITRNTEFNGLDLRGVENGMKYLIRGSGSVSFINCTVQAKNMYKEGFLKMAILLTNSGVYARRSIFKYSDIGIIANGAIDLERCVIYSVSYSYAFDVNNASSVNIINNTFFKNYGCVKLINNTDTGIIKNNIFYGSATYDINAANTGLAVSHSIQTGWLNNVTKSTKVINSNPLFVNEGIYNIDDTNLRIRTKMAGYPVMSPAYELGDDGYDAGAYRVIYAIEGLTYDTIIVQKPYINIEDNPVNAQCLVTKNGRVVTKADAFYRIYSLTWSGILKNDYDKIDVMLKCKKPNVYFYPDPVSNPGVFINCVVMYDTIKRHSKIPAQFGSGSYDLEIKLMHEVSE